MREISYVYNGKANILERFSLVFLMTMRPPSTAFSAAHEDIKTTWMPVGGFYTTFPEFVTEALKVAGRERIYILVVPASFSFNASLLTQNDLLLHTQNAEIRRRQLENVCREIVTGRPCEVALIPLYVRDAALSAHALGYVPDDIAGVYFLGGDQTITMEILANTPLEAALGRAFKRGVPMGGNSAGLAIESRSMIAGYTTEQFGPHNALIEGAVEIWNTEAKRGLDFGVRSVILEQHFWEYARLARFLNVLVQKDVPPVGIGVDALTGGRFHNDSTFGEMFGLYSAAVVDAATYGAVATANYDNPNNTLSVRNILFHTVAPGASSYDTVIRAHSLAAPVAPAERAYEGMGIDENAGTLILGGNLFGPLLEKGAHTLLNHFKQVAGGENIVIVAAGYADDFAACEAAIFYQKALDMSCEVIIATDSYTLPDSLSAVVVIANDQSLINIDTLIPVMEAWKTGTPILMDNAAAAVAGTFYAAEPPTPSLGADKLLLEQATQASFLQGQVCIKPGLGLINAIVEPRVMDDNRWGRVISVVYNHPDLLALALAADTALEFTQGGARVLGKNGVFVFDLRNATLDLGTNQGFVIANAFLDVFAAEESLTPTPITASDTVLKALVS
jgi:cyanophycinase